MPVPIINLTQFRREGRIAITLRSITRGAEGKALSLVLSNNV